MKSEHQREAPIPLPGTQKIPAGGTENLSLKLP
jgi:hypothetical protein